MMLAEPMLNPEERVCLRNLIAERKPARVLEWGAGGSTLYFPAHFPSVEWLAVEHDANYAREVKRRLPKNVALLHLDFPEYWQLREFGKFDLIIVDGRQRVRCLDAARDLLSDGGAVVLHDFTRPRYAPGRAYYRQAVELVAPTNTKDPRGLLMLTEPVADIDSLVDVTDPRGIMYMCWGAPAIAQARASLQSLWEYEPTMPAVVVGEAAAVEAFADLPRVRVVVPDIDPYTNKSLFGFMAGRVKPRLASLSPFEQTLYVDADTAFKRSPQVGFDLLDRWDFVIAEAETRSLALTFPSNATEAGETARWLGTPHVLYHNSGLFFWRRGPATSRLFRMWGEEWLRYRGWDEQIALLRALLLSDVLFLNVPYTWNCRGPQEAFLLYHRFASRSARQFASLAPTVVYNPRHRGQVMTGGRPLIRFEVAPGRVVRIHDGDQEKVMEQYRRMKGK